MLTLIFFLSCTFTQRSILLNCSSVGSESEASCGNSSSIPEQVKVMNLIQVPDKRLLFKATVSLIFRCAYWLHHVVEGGTSLLKLEDNHQNFYIFCC